MKITRVINGKTVNIELTPEELNEAYNEGHYKDGGEWFGKVRWCDDDLEAALTEKNVPVTEENVAKLRQMCSHHSLNDAMISVGWDFIYGCVYKLSENISPKNERVVKAVKRALSVYKSDNVAVVLNKMTGMVDVIFQSDKESFAIEWGVAVMDNLDKESLEKELDALNVGHSW